MMPSRLQSQELWTRLEPLLDRALELEPDERTALLASYRHDDPELHEAALRVLTAESPALQESVLPLATRLLTATGQTPDVAPAAGTRIGPWRIVRLIGEGGMGSVYHAERADGQFDMPVALKIVRGSTGNPDLARRFVDERQLLARLVHPNIARMLDGGVASDGRAYFVMEYVDGTTLPEHLARHALDRAARLRLFLQVCAAVQHAHEHLIVHRDIKPGNIMVTVDGDVNLLDFGLAKALGAGDAPGGPATMLLTPAYASPEQLRGDPVTTASDVYSLGVVLYELMTGRLPADLTRVPPHQWIETLEREPVPQASAVAPRGMSIPADLDAVIATALRIVPGSRYRTVDAFAADIRRVLSAQPVHARRAGALDRAILFCRRHRLGVTITLAAALVLAGFTGLTIRQSQRLREEAAAARAAKLRAERVSTFLQGVFASMYPYGQAGSVPTPARLLENAVSRIEHDFRDAPGEASALLAEISNAYMGIGDFAGAARTAERGVLLERARATPDSIKLAAQLQTLGMMRTYADGGAAGESELRESLAIWRTLLGDTARSTARTLNALGVHLARRGHTTEADSLLRMALDSDRRHRPLDSLLIAQSQRNLGHARRIAGRFDEAAALYADAGETLRRRYGDENAEVGNGFVNLGLALHGAGMRDSALQLVQHGLSIRYRTLGREHDDIAADEVHLAKLHLARGDLRRAEPLVVHALAILRRSRLPSLDLIVALQAHGEIQLALGRRAAACVALTEQAELMTRTGGYAESLQRESALAAAPCEPARPAGREVRRVQR
jgi:serine/threonine-protein kinase